MNEDTKESDAPKKKRGPKMWHEQQEKILKRWGESSSCYRYMHNKAYQKYKKLSMRFTLPIIVISTITGTANFAQSMFPASWLTYVPLVIGAFNLIAAIMTTVLQFLKVNELMESHRVTSIQYGKLARNIRLELTLPLTERKHDGYNMVEICRSEYDRLIEQSPAVPKKIIMTFEDDLEANKKQHDVDEENTFTRPEILTVTPITLFDREAEEEKIRQRHLKHLEELKQERELRAASQPAPAQQAPFPAYSRRQLISEIETLNNKKLVTRSRTGCFTAPEVDVGITSDSSVPTHPASLEQIEIDIPLEERDREASQPGEH